MNWVGGSRTRVLIKQERRKQKEYFERNRLKSKMKLLGVLSPVKNSTVSLDLLNLYVVNQISCKKKIPETIKKPIHVNMNRDIKMPLRHHELEFPVSPQCIPSKLCLVDTENKTHYQKLHRKKELGEVQSSQVMDSSTVFEPQSIKIENCSLTPSSFSADVFSNKYIPKQNFIQRMISSSQKVVYEKKQNEQLSNVNSSKSLISKINKSQDDFSSSYKTAYSGTLFEGLTSYSEEYQLKNNCQKEHNNEVNYLSTSFEQNCYPSNFEEKGTLENHYRGKTPQENIQEYPVNSVQVFRGNISFEELHPTPSLDFGLGEVPMKEEEGTCFLKDRPTSTQKIFLDSSQSSQSASYSPRPTDSCFSTSSEMPSEDEDQILQQTEDSNKRNLKTTEETNNFYLEKVAKLSDDRIVKDDAQIYKQNDDFHQLLMKNNTDQFPQFKCNLAHTLQSKTSNGNILEVARCDVEVQTDREPVMEGKIDAATQCDIIPKCPCRSDMSPCSSQRCSENIKADTTGGQEILKNS